MLARSNALTSMSITTGLKRSPWSLWNSGHRSFQYHPWVFTVREWNHSGLLAKTGPHKWG